MKRLPEGYRFSFKGYFEASSPTTDGGDQISIERWGELGSDHSHDLVTTYYSDCYYPDELPEYKPQPHG